MEVFKNICDVYQVSSKGRVRNTLTGKILKSRVKKTGYVELQLGYSHNRKFFLVHRLVAKAFVENKCNKREVNHIDNNRTNNDVENLEWVTASENSIHRINTGNCKDIRGSENHMAKIDESLARHIKYDFDKSVKHTSIAKEYNLSPNLVGRIRRNECWSHI